MRCQKSEFKLDEEISVYYKVLFDTFRSLALVYRKINQLQEANQVLRKTFMFDYSIQDSKRTT